MVSKLATFRTDSDIWDSFQDKAKSKGTNASALLQKFVRDYLDDKLDSRIDSAAAPDVDIESMINHAIAPLLARLEALETTRIEATAPANFSSALLQRAKEVAPIKLMQVSTAPQERAA